MRLQVAVEPSESVQLPVIVKPAAVNVRVVLELAYTLGPIFVKASPDSVRFLLITSMSYACSHPTIIMNNIASICKNHFRAI